MEIQEKKLPAGGMYNYRFENECFVFLQFSRSQYTQPRACNKNWILYLIVMYEAFKFYLKQCICLRHQLQSFFDINQHCN